MKLASDTEPVQDENKTDDAEINTIEPSNPILSSVQEDPIKPVTPVTFPESGTESEVSKTIYMSIAFTLSKYLMHVYSIKLWYLFIMDYKSLVIWLGWC